MINPRLEEKLTNALAGGPRSAAAKELFMHGGCHAWAMAAAMQWGGSIRCSTTAIYSNAAGRQVLEDCNHAWYEIGGRVADFLGWAETRMNCSRDMPSPRNSIRAFIRRRRRCMRALR
jgi:hypothetical protein